MTTTPMDVHTTGWSPLRWLSSLGLRLVSYFAKLDDGNGGATSYGRSKETEGQLGPPCPEIGEGCTRVRCCCLACAKTECPYTGSKSNFYCTEGYIKTLWTCNEGTTVIACGECAGGDSCVDYPWQCSIWYVSNQGAA